MTKTVKGIGHIAIVMPVSNHWEVTEQALHDILEHTTEYEDYEVIVVDGASTDETSTRLWTEERRDRRIRAVYLRENKGFATSVNEGMRMALQHQAEYIVLLNNDIRIWQDGWLEALMAPFLSGRKLVVGPDLIDYNEATRVDGEIVPYIGGWCMAFPSELFTETGGMDENLDPAFYEDGLFCAKAEEAGYRLVSVDVPVEHLYGKTALDGRFNIAEIHEVNRPYFDNAIRQMRLIDAVGVRVLFLCPGNRPFNDASLESEGLGGAEAALIQLTRALAVQGVDVTVANNLGVAGAWRDLEHRGVYEGTEYNIAYRDCVVDQEAILSPAEWDALVLFRCTPDEHSHFWQQFSARRRIFWTCDQYTDPYWREGILPHVDKVIGISQHHEDFLRDYWQVPSYKLTHIPLGITPADYRQTLPKIPNSMIYCSVPLRGLSHLARIFPRVKQALPDATLTITADYTLWGTADPGDAESRAQFLAMDGVRYLGAIPREDLIVEQKRAELHAYPCDYTVEMPWDDTTNAGENFCLASLECQAAATPTVTTPCGALTTTVHHGYSGHILAGTYPYDPAYDDRFARVLIDLLTEWRPGLVQMQAHARQRAMSMFAWPNLARRWISELLK